MSDLMHIRLAVNGEERELFVACERTLLSVLREDLGLTGAKCGCNQGVCGACTVLVDGAAMRACLLLPAMLTHRAITTIEALEVDGELHPVQDALMQHGGLQCGFCTPGMVLAAKALLDTNGAPTVHEIRHALGGNICRCTGYVKIIEAVTALTQRTPE
jgi:carbon-monoxide dehydrogenase small subunit